MEYNYLKAMIEDIKEYINIKKYINNEELSFDDYNREELEEKLHDDLWVADSVTGNASGSYTFNRYKAQEYVLDNMDLLEEMCQEFGIDAKTIGEKFLSCDWEWMDVSIRCHLLGQAISETLDEIEEELNSNN